MGQNSYYPHQTKISRFFKDLEDGKLMATRCLSCKNMYFPPRAECPRCFKENMEWIEVSGKGELVTYTVVHIAPERWEDFVPFIVAVGKLDEGPQVMAVLEGINFEDIEIGMKLRLVPSARAKGYPEPSYKYKFEPVL